MTRARREQVSLLDDEVIECWLKQYALSRGRCWVQGYGAAVVLHVNMLDENTAKWCAHHLIWKHGFSDGRAVCRVVAVQSIASNN